ncbi:tRNA-dihydrouridine(47) synthase [NAD(P)(+)] [Scheffersomyces coipomensis]|uniref:tRNA-dihydrouridine(47) synthase [NAD(P)(+)] n=1 Tax=Scheffersomyces coipomensis TaxID=1788519 RepID=UPI00315D3DEF
MSSLQEKRPADPVVEEPTEVKKQHVEYPKGVAVLKAEYIIQTPVNDNRSNEYDDDEAEGGERSKGDGNNNNNGGGKKRRGQNKNRDLRQKKEEIRLCSTLLDPDNIKECNFGAEKCRNSHNVEEYLASKPADIDGVCPVYQAIGYCPTGLKCRWLKSHYVEGKLLRKEAQDIKQDEEVNKISHASKDLLRKKKYDFKIANQVIPYIDSQIQNEENLEKRKDNEASFVEAPFKVSEKKKLYLKDAKIVSPLTTVGNLPYRRLMKTLGADITYSEMALTIPMLQATAAEWALPKAHKSEYPGFGVQIATSKHYQAAKVTEAIYRETTSVSEINLNCGCPIDLLYRQGQGSALMDQPAKLIRILKSMNYSSGDIPITVKMRTGTKDNKNTAISLVDRIMKENDVAAITLHGRSRQQRYTREADWSYVGDVAKTVKEWNEKKLDDKEKSDTQPTWFIGNGDIYTHEDWYNAMAIDGVDSVMVARGALIKPWIFEEIEAQQYLDKSASERLDMLKTFSNFAIEHWGSDEYGVGLARRFMCEFLSFTHRYIPIGILERLPPKINQRPPLWRGRNEMETLLGSTDYKDWIKITEMFLGKTSPEFQFTPKHKSNSYEKS